MDIVVSTIPWQLYPGTEPWYHLNMKMGEPNSWSEWFREEKTCCLCQDLNPDLSSQKPTIPSRDFTGENKNIGMVYWGKPA
jgi:hypothetical protein